MAGFADALNKNIQALQQEVNDKCVTIATDLFNQVVTNTPIDKGLLINNWFPEDSDLFSTTITDSLDKTGIASLSRISQLSKSTAFLGQDGCFTMTNNVPYAQTAESLGWPSGHPPYRMVALAVQAIVAKANK